MLHSKGWMVETEHLREEPSESQVPTSTSLQATPFQASNQQEQRKVLSPTSMSNR